MSQRSEVGGSSVAGSESGLPPYMVGAPLPAAPDPMERFRPLLEELVSDGPAPAVECDRLMKTFIGLARLTAELHRVDGFDRMIPLLVAIVCEHDQMPAAVIDKLEAFVGRLIMKTDGKEVLRLERIKARLHEVRWIFTCFAGRSC